MSKYKDEIKDLDLFQLAAKVNKTFVEIMIPYKDRFNADAKIKCRIVGKPSLMTCQEARNYLEKLYVKGRQTQRINV